MEKYETSAPNGETFEEYIPPPKNEKIPLRGTESSSKSGPRRESVFTDRTYIHKITHQKITVETVDIKGTINGDGLKLATGEQTKFNVLKSRRADTVIFAIPKMKLVTRRK